jgi:hypothetical protein
VMWWMPDVMRTRAFADNDCRPPPGYSIVR